mmetsp:Transcript_60742/g.96511  ORF Transcript_60742/g.96511 Transcript_60742/m.96511 type:complete len:394 (-) Transcript_60742:197-1378(-)
MGRTGSLCSDPNSIQNDGQYPAVNTQIHATDNTAFSLFFVTNARAQQTLTIANIRPSSTIKHVRHEIATKLDVNPTDITVNLSNRKPLNRLNLTVSDYDIAPNSTLFVNVHIIDEVTHHLDVQVGSKVVTLQRVPRDDTTLAMLREAIQTAHGTPVAKQLLFRNDGHQLADSGTESKQSLSELGIQQSVRLEVAAKFTSLDGMLQREDVTLYDDQMPHYRVRGKLGDKYDIMHWYKIKKNRAINKAVFDSILSTMSDKSVKTVFHGTSFETIGKIVENGFNRDYNIRSAYGKGVYFARNAQLAAKYSKPDADGYLAMLVCDVIVGECTVGSRDMPQSALYKPGTSTQFDTLVNRLEKPSVYVVRRDYHAIPKYILVFRRNSVTGKKKKAKKKK